MKIRTILTNATAVSASILMVSGAFMATYREAPEARQAGMWGLLVGLTLAIVYWIFR